MEHTELIVRVGVRRLHGIIIALLIILHRNLVLQFAARFSGVRVVNDTTGDRGGVVFLFILIFSLSFGAVGHFGGLVVIGFFVRIMNNGDK